MVMLLWVGILWSIIGDSGGIVTPLWCSTPAWHPSYMLTGKMGTRPLYERFRFPLRRLYNLRLRVDYHVEPITLEIADWALELTQDLIQTIGNIERRTS